MYIWRVGVWRRRVDVVRWPCVASWHVACGRMRGLTDRSRRVWIPRWIPRNESWIMGWLGCVAWWLASVRVSYTVVVCRTRSQPARKVDRGQARRASSSHPWPVCAHPSGPSSSLGRSSVDLGCTAAALEQQPWRNHPPVPPRVTRSSSRTSRRRRTRALAVLGSIPGIPILHRLVVSSPVLGLGRLRLASPAHCASSTRRRMQSSRHPGGAIGQRHHPG